MKWDELSDKDKVKLILEHVFGYYFVESEQYVDQHRGKLPAGFHWPIAWWDETLEMWGTRDMSSDWNTSFDPLCDMNDAWKIVELFDEIELSKHVKDKYHCRLWRGAADGSAVAKTPQDAVCIAALEAVGVYIE